MSKIKNLIVGCGFSGATLACKIAQERNEKVVVIDSKDHIAGNSYDYWDNNGICVHKYGTHIFHTNLKPVWDFISRFTKWYPYQHKVNGQFISIPFNLNSLYQVFPKSLANKIELCLIEKFGLNKKIPILELRKISDETFKKKIINFIIDYRC
jgi:UDP-galactopyranose mutase